MRVPFATSSMVDDVATVNVCNTVEGINMNTKNEVFVKCKKLTLQNEKGKCQYIHIGPLQCNSCYCANGKQLEQEKATKYLGNYLSNDLDVLYEKRAEKSLGYAIQCIGMSMEISVGYRLYSVARTMHESIFLNGSMVNMETWTHCDLTRIKLFEKYEQYFMRTILDAHSKTSIEHSCFKWKMRSSGLNAASLFFCYYLDSPNLFKMKPHTFPHMVQPRCW